MTTLAAILQRLRLVKADAQLPPRGPLSLARLCAEGALVGGLSVAADVRPDELFGPLTARVGGLALKLRVLDVRDEPQLRIVVSLEGKEFSWDVRDAVELTQELNALLEEDRAAAAVAYLGEWEDDAQLWCVPKDQLGELLRESDFAPLNRRQLVKLAAHVR